MGATLGNTVSYLAAGFLLASFSWRGFSESQLLVAIAAAGLVWLYGARMFEGDEVPSKKPRPFQELKALARNPVILVMVLVRSFNQIARQVTITFLPIYLVEQLGLSDIELGIYLTPMAVSGLLAQPVMGVLSDRLGRKRVMVPGLVWTAAMALALVVFDTGIPFTATVAFLGLFLYPDQPVLTASVFDLVGPDVGSTALGIVSFAGGLMAAASPLVAGALYQASGFGTVATYAAALFAASALAFGTIPVPGPDEDRTGA
jgi:MFS family permease